MPHALLIVHSSVRWLVLLVGLMTVARLATGYSRQAVWRAADLRFSRAFVGLLDLQFLLGLVLYAVSPVTRGAMSHAAGALSDPHARFFVAEHPMLMFIALCVAHGASVWARRAPADRAKFLRSSLGFAMALGLIAAGIPWFRMGAR